MLAFPQTPGLLVPTPSRDAGAALRGCPARQPAGSQPAGARAAAHSYALRVVRSEAGRRPSHCRASVGEEARSAQ